MFWPGLDTGGGGFDGGTSSAESGGRVTTGGINFSTPGITTENIIIIGLIAAAFFLLIKTVK